mgnify:CR=1 FL=1
MKKPYIFPLLLGSLVLTGCANGQIDAMQMRLNQQEQQIRLLNSQLSGVQPAQADTWAQVQSLRQEMSAVKGQIDDFNNATAAAGYYIQRIVISKIHNRTCECKVAWIYSHRLTDE